MQRLGFESNHVQIRAAVTMLTALSPYGDIRAGVGSPSETEENDLALVNSIMSDFSPALT